MSGFSYIAIGYHGCPASCAEQVQQGGVEAWQMSNGWLGEGIYFWDNDESTGHWWARQHHGNSDPCVITAEIDLTKVLDLTNVFGQNALKKLRRLSRQNPETGERLEQLEDDGLSED